MAFDKRGFRYSFTSVEVQDGAAVFEGLTSLNYAIKIEGRDHVYGNSRKSYGQPAGTLMVESTCGFIKEAWFDFVAAHPQYLDERFDVVFFYQEGSRNDKIEIIGLLFNESSADAEGTDATKVEVPGTALDIKVNGVSVISDPRTDEGT
jgi:hypothetical protein